METDTIEQNYPESFPARKITSIRLKVINKRLPIFLRWLNRMPALSCNGKILFYNINQVKVFDKTMSIRWIRSQMPIPIDGEWHGKLPHIYANNENIEGKLRIYDPDRFMAESRIDIYPGEEEIFDVVARFDNDNDCYGWCNESFISKPLWRNPERRLNQGIYLLKIEINSSGTKLKGDFSLTNINEDFRIKKQ